MTRTDVKLTDLYEADETAWLEAMAERIRHGTYSELDYAHLEEYLSDMAKRDRREVEDLLALLITHILNWLFQPEKRSGIWRGTIIAQRRELAGAADRGVLRNHAAAVLAAAYEEAVERAAAETGLPASVFPAECPYTLNQLLSVDLTATEN